MIFFMFMIGQLYTRGIWASKRGTLHGSGGEPNPYLGMEVYRVKVNHGKLRTIRPRSQLGLNPAPFVYQF